MHDMLKSFINLILESHPTRGSRERQTLEANLEGSGFRIVTEPKKWPEDQLYAALVFADEWKEGRTAGKVGVPDILRAETLMAQVLDMAEQPPTKIHYDDVTDLALRAQRIMERPEYASLLRKQKNLRFGCLPIPAPQSVLNDIRQLVRLTNGETPIARDDRWSFPVGVWKNPFDKGHTSHVSWSPAPNPDHDIFMQLHPGGGTGDDYRVLNVYMSVDQLAALVNIVERRVAGGDVDQEYEEWLKGPYTRGPAFGGA